MKKRTLIFAAAALAAGLTACAPKAGETQPPATIEETQEMTQEPATDDSDEPETQEPGGTENGETSDGGAGETAQSSDELLGKVYTAVKEAYGEKYVPGMMFDEAMLEGTFGISKDQYDSYVAEGPMISVHVLSLIHICRRDCWNYPLYDSYNRRIQPCGDNADEAEKRSGEGCVLTHREDMGYCAQIRTSLCRHCGGCQGKTRDV